MRTVSLLTVAILTLAACPALAQAPDQKAQPCPGASSATTTGSTGAQNSTSADNPANKQGVEHSAVLPDAGGHKDSAAPTVQKDGQDIVANTECPKEPNRLESPRRQE